VSDSDPRSDRELVRAASQGDRSAFEAIYFRHRDWVVRLAGRLTGDRDDALDVPQETFAYLWRKLPDLELRARLTTFLYPAVKNLSIAAARKRRRYVTGDDLPEPPVEAPAPGSSRAELAAVVGVLPEGQRDVLLMRFVDSMSLDEIAAALAIPLGTVKSRLHNALAALREDQRTRDYFQG